MSDERKQHGGGPRGGDNRGHNHNNDPQELESKTILIQNKRFYLDVKENNRGRFLKIAEVTPGGHKNRVTMAMHILPEFRDLLGEFIDHYAQLGPSTVEESSQEQDQNRRPLKTARIMRGQRRYFLDLKENVRGRYLRVRAPGQTNDMPQQVIVLPASGMIEFRDTLTGLIENFGTEEDVEEDDDEELPQSATIGSRRSKVFYMDVGRNPRGIYVRMTEQSANYRQSITVPDRHFRAIGEWFLHAAEQLEANGHKMPGDNGFGEGDGNRRAQNAHAPPQQQQKPVGGGGANNRRRSRDDDEYDEYDE